MKDEEVILRVRDGMAKWVGKLIRCKDCKYWYGNADTDECRWADYESPDAEDFCSYAERRER